MDVDPRLLRSFVAVADELHFGRAAARLYITQPALSQQIRRLERDLGIRLFDRDKRRVELTVAGTTLLELARPAVAAIAAVGSTARQLRRVDQQQLVVGFHVRWPGDLLTRAARAFRRDHPTVDLELRQFDFTDSTVGLRSGEADLGLLHLPISMPGVSIEPLFSSPRVLMVSEEHPLAPQPTIELSDLLPHPTSWAVPVLDDPAWRSFWSLEDERTEIGLSTVSTSRPATMEALLQSVAMGGVVAVTSAYVEEVYGPPGVRFLPVRDVDPGVAAVAWVADVTHPSRQAFVDTLVPLAGELQTSR
jgi:DNA-binding transcriptional LysR family regulator